MNRMRLLSAAFAILLPALAAGAAEVGAPAEVAPGVAGTRIQMWPSAAWSEGAKCWLLAWREGDITEDESDIWCARVSADGKALDPAGIKVCAAKDRQERPRVASDGKDFLVAWEDFRNGKDYDVYAARVTADGKVLDPDGFLVAGGEHNQCRPAAAFAGGSYFLAWQSFVAAGAEPDRFKDNYRLQGARVSRDGRPEKIAQLASDDYTHMKRAACKPQITNVVAAAGSDNIWLAYMIGPNLPPKNSKTAAVLKISAATGQPDGAPQVLGPAGYATLGRYIETYGLLPSLAWGKDGGLLAVPGPQGYGHAIELWRLDASGKQTGNPGQLKPGAPSHPPLFSVAWDQERYLLAMDSIGGRGKTGQMQMKVLGLIVPAEGDLKAAVGNFDKDQQGKPPPGQPFAIAGDGERDQMQGFACAGPRGVFLVAYCEVRGADDTKVLARIVK